MRKLLLGTTALAAAATLTANAALADVSISGSAEWSYNSRSSNAATLDGTTFGTDHEDDRSNDLGDAINELTDRINRLVGSSSKEDQEE